MKKIFLFIIFVYSIGLAQTITFNTLGTWQSNGVPNYLEPVNDIIDASLLSRVNASLPESQKVPNHHPNYLSNTTQTNVYLTEECDVWVTFITEGAGYKNVLGFYTYQAGNPPTSISDIQNSLTIIFPNASQSGSGGGLNPGNKVKIGRFSANTVIGWFVAANGFSSATNITTGNWLLFSDYNLNPQTNVNIKQQNVLLQDPVTGKLVLGFEDIRRDNGGCDQDFNDVLFNVTANPVEAISTIDLPVMEDPNQNNLADLQIVKSVNNNTPENGDVITFTLTVKNNGPSGSSSISVSDVIPQGIIYQSHVASKGTYNSADGKWSITSLSVGESATLNITCLVDRFSSTYNLGIASDFNVFCLNDMNQPSCDTEGRVAAGNNAYFANYSVGDKLDTLSGVSDVLIVGNNLIYESGAIYNGNVVYGNLTNLPINQVSINNGIIRQDSVINFASADVELKTLSNMLKGYSINGTTTLTNSELSLTGTHPLFNSFLVSKEQLNAATDFIINVPNGSVVLVNISGNGIEWKGGHVVHGTAKNNVLYNFYEAVNLEIRNIDIQGSVLAPLADLEFPSGLISGQVIAKNISGQGQFNWHKFLGDIPIDNNIYNIASVSSSVTIDPTANNNSSQVLVNIIGEPNPNPPSATVQWNALSTFPITEMVWTMIETDDNIYVGTYGGKIYKSSDVNGTWNLINEGMNVGYIWSLDFADGTLYAGTEIGLFATSDDGANWINLGLGNFDVRAVLLNSSNTESFKIYAGTWGSGIFVSTDFGATWKSSNSGLPNLAVQTLVKGDNGVIYAGTFGGGVAKSEDNGNNWSKMNCAASHIWKLAVDKSGNIYAGTYGEGLYKLNDNNWIKSDIGITSQHVYSISFDNTNSVYVSSWNSGVFASTNTGNNWESLGMQGMAVSSVIIDSKSNQVVVGTAYGELFNRPAVIVGVDNELINIKSFGIQQNYPNPFNPNTTIRYNIPKAANVKLEIYDILGRLVTTLVDTYQQAGEYNITFNANGLTSGIYLYKITTDFNSAVKKMVLVK
jgi:choice-of-anchor A domain-containing protein/uncharacterized repeat protein (TIGR01451 family)